MRLLIPGPTTADPDVDLHAHYGRDWLHAGGLRVNFVSSVDGAATSDGLSRGLQTRGDNRVFAALRDLCDVVLAGGGTVRAEGYGPTRLSERRIALRREHGLAEWLPIAVVSRTLRLDAAAPLFTEAPPQARTIVITSAASDGAARAALGQVADVVVCGDVEVDLALARRELEGRGLFRILGEGGPTLFGDLAGAGVVDELCLSITPRLAGPGSGRIVAGRHWAGEAPPLQLTGLLEEDGALFCRYALDRGGNAVSVEA